MKNKEITMYELIRLIKDGRAPYEVIYQGTKYYIDELENYYRAEDRTPLFEQIFDNYNDYEALQEKVEILPKENDEQHIEMQFPDTFEEFIKSYSFIDDKEIYTNGSELIPTFRLQQWIEHKKEENDEWEDIEKLDKDHEYLFGTINCILNKIIKNQKYIKEKLEDNTCIKTKTKLCNLIDERIEEKLESQRGPFMDEIRIDTPKWIEDPKKRKVGD